MRTIRFIPGNIVSPNAHALPAGAPDIDVVVSAQITRMVDTITLAHVDSGAAVGHLDGAVVPHAGFALEDHNAHMHDIITFGAAGAPAGGVFGLDAVPTATELQDSGAAGAHAFAGGGATGIQNQTPSAHNVTEPAQHTAAAIVLGLADHAGALIAAALNAHVVPGVTPEVGVVPTIITARTFSLNLDTELGDLLTFSYHEVGDRVLTS